MKIDMLDSPRLKRTSPKANAGIVHIGPGAFFRAFNAPFTDEAVQAEGGDWGIVAVSLRSATAKEQLAPQDCAYTSVTLAPDGQKHQIINSISDIMVARDDPASVVAIMADPKIKIVSLTITEKGYCYSSADRGLDFQNPDVAHDLLNLDAPSSAIGFLVSALQKRWEAGFPSFTVLSCDNLPSNGELTRTIVLEFAQSVDPALATWIETETPFPSTMVDRITPATTDQDIETLAQQAGYLDRACVMHEPFRQWVIEDNFVNGRPAWEVAGAQFVTSVNSHELMKLRCLNGTHSTLAYLGYLAGYKTIAETVSDPAFTKLCKKLWAEEIIPTLPQPEGEDLHSYCDALLTRYQNPAIQHQTWQIAMDGSQKLPQRILNTISDNLLAGRSITGLSLAIAGWMRYVSGIDENGEIIDVRDPLAEKLKQASDSKTVPEQKVAALLSFDNVFAKNLATNETFISEVTQSYTRLFKSGAKVAVAEFTET